jgi:hypothetical protein
MFHRVLLVPGWQAAVPPGVKSQAVLPEPWVLRHQEPGVSRSVLAWVLRLYVTVHQLEKGGW